MLSIREPLLPQTSFTGFQGKKPNNDSSPVRTWNPESVRNFDKLLIFSFFNFMFHVSFFSISFFFIFICSTPLLHHTSDEIHFRLKGNYIYAIHKTCVGHIWIKTDLGHFCLCWEGSKCFCVMCTSWQDHVCWLILFLITDWMDIYHRWTQTFELQYVLHLQCVSQEKPHITVYRQCMHILFATYVITPTRTHAQAQYNRMLQALCCRAEPSWKEEGSTGCQAACSRSINDCFYCCLWTSLHHSVILSHSWFPPFVHLHLFSCARSKYCMYCMDSTHPNPLWISKRPCQVL